MARGGRHNPNGLRCGVVSTVRVRQSLAGAANFGVSTELDAMLTVEQDLHSPPLLQGAGL